MKEIVNIKTIGSMLPVFGMVILLLISPCRVRNYIQAELGTTQTEVANKSKSSIGTSSCIDYTSNTSSTIVKKYISQLLSPSGGAIALYSLPVTAFSDAPFSELSTRGSSVSVVPLYILYQNFKVYL